MVRTLSHAFADSAYSFPDISPCLDRALDLCESGSHVSIIVDLVQYSYVTSQTRLLPFESLQVGAGPRKATGLLHTLNGGSLSRRSQDALLPRISTHARPEEGFCQPVRTGFPYHQGTVGPQRPANQNIGTHRMRRLHDVPVLALWILAYSHDELQLHGYASTWAELRCCLLSGACHRDS